MAMPWQLREGLKKRVKGALPRPIVEKCPSISANDLNIPSLNDPQTYTLPNISLKYSWLAAVRLNHAIIELTLRSAHRATLGRTQKFKIKHIRTGLGKAGSHGIRHAFICDCGEPVIKLHCL